MRITLIAGLVALFASTAPAQGQPEVLVLEGDSVPGVGLVTRIDNLVVNNPGDWIVEADTDHANTDMDVVLIKSGALFLREGQSLSQPPGASIDSFDAVTLNDLGNSGWNFFLSGTTGSNDNSGIYYDSTLVLQEGTVSGAAGFSPGTPYIGFFETKINHLNQVLVMASVDDPAIASSVDRGLVVLRLSAGGALVSETVIWKEGDFLPGQTDQIDDFGTGPHQFAWNDPGQALFFADLSGSTATDGVIYQDAVLLAQEGSASPVAGRNWELLSSRPLDQNELGDVVFRGNLDGDTATDEVIVRNGAVLVQEGDVLAAIAPFKLTSFGTGPVRIDDNGDVLWYGEWDDPNTAVNSGLFMNDQLLVQEGVTVIGGQVLESLSRVQDGFNLSRDGSYVLFEGELAGGLNGAFRLGLGLRLADPAPGQACVANTFSVSGATPGGAIVYVYGVPSGATNVPGCPGLTVGLQFPIIFGTATANGAGTAVLSKKVPCKASGRTIRIQAVERATCRASNLNAFTFP